MLRPTSSSLLAAAVAAGLLTAPTPALAREAGVHLLACHQDRRPEGRYLIVESSMRAGQARERLEVRFDLHHRGAAGRPWVRVPGPGLGAPNRAAASVGTFRFRKRIANLAAAGDYRVTATFRWLTASGQLVQQAVRAAPHCHQAELPPDVVVSPGG